VPTTPANQSCLAHLLRRSVGILLGNVHHLSAALLGGLYRVGKVGGEEARGGEGGGCICMCSSPVWKGASDSLGGPVLPSGLAYAPQNSMHLHGKKWTQSAASPTPSCIWPAGCNRLAGYAGSHARRAMPCSLPPEYVQLLQLASPALPEALCGWAAASICGVVRSESSTLHTEPHRTPGEASKAGCSSCTLPAGCSCFLGCPTRP
jgi:hypothetical protein